MKQRILSALCAAMLLVGVLSAGEALRSGPQVGSSKIPAFNPLNCTGAHEGKRTCLVRLNGGNPVAMIFARDVSAPLTRLIKMIDEATARNSKARMGSFVVFLSDTIGSKQLKELATRERLRHCVLSLHAPDGPKGYGLAREADVTVVPYRNRHVMANHAFRKGELNDAAISKILADVPKILPKAKAR
ncbi:MAG: hypothetical protein FJ271_09715 [Planctomycetes bacterium]|nr:hypothetical protein [Planctomycetota bacterium]